MSTPPKRRASMRGLERAMSYAASSPALVSMMTCSRNIVATLAEKVVEPHHLVRRHHLRQHERGWRPRGGENVLEVGKSDCAPRAVDAHHPFDTVVSLGGGEDGERVAPCLVLVLRGDAVLELDAHDVRARGERLRKAVGPQRGREDEAAPRAGRGCGARGHGLLLACSIRPVPDTRR